MQQIIGMPMGTDPGSFMANAHLYKYEFDFPNPKSVFGYRAKIYILELF